MEHRAADVASQDIETHLKALYHAYRQTSDIDAKGLFFSQNCLQTCRPNPSYAATSRSQIVQYLKDAQQGRVPLEHSVDSEKQTSAPTEKSLDGDTGRYTIRWLLASEHEFGDGAATEAIGLTPSELEAKAEAEGWVGLRVDLWDEGTGDGLLVKVQYWWRAEIVADEGVEAGAGGGMKWRQCLHDIMYLGPRDGTEGGEGVEVLK
ncbi:hypothetical protein N0V86_006212 [Didymella sp. IMI 355093]|nr:hypothetical protein N0V86_006212 [Didymella sp. IMI 355093]